jgi:hypothetical protein
VVKTRRTKTRREKRDGRIAVSTRQEADNEATENPPAFAVRITRGENKSNNLMVVNTS